MHARGTDRVSELIFSLLIRRIFRIIKTIAGLLDGGAGYGNLSESGK